MQEGIPKRIQLVRKLLNLSQEEFAKKLGISRGYLANIEKGLRTPPDRILKLISQTFGVSYEWLKEGKGEIWTKEPEVTVRDLEIIEYIIRKLKELEEEYEVEIPPAKFAKAVIDIYKHVKEEIQKNPEEKPQQAVKKQLGKIIRFAG